MDANQLQEYLQTAPLAELHALHSLIKMQKEETFPEPPATPLEKWCREIHHRAHQKLIEEIEFTVAARTLTFLDPFITELQKRIEPGNVNGWKDASQELPPCNELGDSEYLLGMEGDNHDRPVVVWFSKIDGGWRVAHYKADSLPIKITHWLPLPPLPKTDENE